MRCVQNSTSGLLLALHWQERLQTCLKLGKTQQGASTQSRSARFQAIPCQQPTWIRCNGHIEPHAGNSNGNHLVILLTHRYSKLRSAVPVSETKASHAALNLTKMGLCGTEFLNYLLKDKEPQLIGKLFNALCSFLRFKELVTTANHRQKNSQTEWYNKIIVSPLPQKINEHHSFWDRFVQPFTNVYNTASYGCLTARCV